MLAAGAALSGCGTIHYLYQAGKGQLEFSNRARPISEVVKDERTSPRIRALLAEVAPIKKFGEGHGLKPTKNYTEYVQLKRPAAVWVVSACAPLEFESKEWSFPIVGRFPYLGWFDLEDARKYAQELKSEGWDVDLRGARAFSTLGWFRDPVVSSMLPEGEEALGDLVNVVLHESVHATFYIPGQAYFNESIASFVADHLTREYLGQARGLKAPETVAYQNSEADDQKIQKKLHEAYEKLDALYKSPDSASSPARSPVRSPVRSKEEKLAQKEKILAALKEQLHFKRDLNNATLIQFKTYNTGDEDFEAISANCGHDWRRFWKAIQRISSKSFSKPQQEDLKPVLSPLGGGVCPSA